MFCCFRKKNKLHNALDTVKEEIKENIDIVLDKIDDNAEEFVNSLNFFRSSSNL